jgi:hypothetical protein
MLEVEVRQRERHNTAAAVKRETRSTLWARLENDLWLKIKPHKKLPWYGAEMQVTLSRILKY